MCSPTHKQAALAQGPPSCICCVVTQTFRHPTKAALIWIQALSLKVVVGESKGVRTASSSTINCLQVPPNTPIFSNSLHKGGNHLGNYQSLRMETQCSWHGENNYSYNPHPVTHTGHQCISTNSSSEIFLHIVFWLL